MKNVCIVFNGGSYGTFTEWCLNYFSDENFPTDLPFTESGNSHKFVGNNLVHIANVIRYINSDSDFMFVRMHPKTFKGENILDNLDIINQNFKKIIYLTPTTDTIAWNINNKFEKIYPEGWLERAKDQLVNNKVERWNSSYTDINDMKPWELRECLSLFLYEQHLSESELVRLPEIINRYSNFHFITFDRLRDHFKEELLSLLDYCQLKLIRANDIDKIYSSWMACQYHANKDALISKIIRSALENEMYEWSDQLLTIADESLIQYYLRQHGIKLKCHNLNIFPTNTKELISYFE
jgi:hypothetical protein